MLYISDSLSRPYSNITRELIRYTSSIRTIQRQLKSEFQGWVPNMEFFLILVSQMVLIYREKSLLYTSEPSQTWLIFFISDFRQCYTYTGLSLPTFSPFPNIWLLYILFVCHRVAAHSWHIVHWTMESG